MTLYVPNCLKKRAYAKGVSHDFYTIISLSSLCKGSIDRVKVVWAQQGKVEYAIKQYILLFLVGRVYLKRLMKPLQSVR